MVSLAQVKNRTDLPVILLAYLDFIALGMPSQLLGIAWPSMRQAFNLPLDAVGALLTATALGYTLSSFYSGRMVYRLGYARLLILSGVVGIVGALCYVFAPTWEVIVAAGAIVGVGGGAIDAALNTYFAANYGPRPMSWLHACYGIGTVVGPFLMTRLIVAEQPWQWGYMVVAAIIALVVTGIALTSGQWRQRKISDTTSTTHGLTETLRLPVVWLMLALIILVVGVELSPGQWTYTLFTESRSMLKDQAGLLVTLYWTSFTVGRILFGFIGNNLKPASALRVSMFAAVVGAAFIWWNGGPEGNTLGLLIMGIALAPIFPLLVTAMPERVGQEHAANAIGFLISAAGVGVGILPALVGVIAKNFGLELIGLLLVGMAVAMFLLHEALMRYRTAPTK